jgi:hypothetical protein
MSGEAWTEALESELTFARILSRHAFWRENPPPAALLTAIAVGMGVWEPKKKPEGDSVNALRTLFPSGRF